MFDSILNLAAGVTKVAVNVVVAPVALAVDVVTLPASADDLHSGPFDRTAKALKGIGEGVEQAIDVNKS